jgi:serine/threonine protein kinase
VVGYIDAQYDTKINTLFIFLEYVPGGSIASMLERFGRFTEDLVRNYTRQLLLGLEYLHGCRIVHRDLKVIFVLYNMGVLWCALLEYNLGCSGFRVW